jgi:hypothetical protein
MTECDKVFRFANTQRSADAHHIRGEPGWLPVVRTYC